MKKRREAPANHDRWLVSYADLITLLFALFVVLYAMSRADTEKFKQVAESLHREFGPSRGEPAAPVAPNAPAVPGSPEAPAAEGSRGQRIQNMREALEEGFALTQNAGGGSGDADVESVADGAVVSFRADGFWKPGQIEIHEDVRPLIDRIGQVIAQALKGPGAFEVRIEGHTDEREDQTREGWALSSARASWLARYWIGKFALDPARLSVAGFSHFKPMKQASGSPRLASRNRRLEVVITEKKASSAGLKR